MVPPLALAFLLVPALQAEEVQDFAPACLQMVQAGAQAFLRGEEVSSAAAKDGLTECFKSRKDYARVETLLVQATGLQKGPDREEPVTLYQEKLRITARRLWLSEPEQKQAVAFYMARAQSGREKATARAPDRSPARRELEAEAASNLLARRSLPQGQQDRIRARLKGERLPPSTAEDFAVAAAMGEGLPDDPSKPFKPPPPSMRSTAVPMPGAAASPRDTVAIRSRVAAPAAVGIPPVRMPKEDYKTLMAELHARRAKATQEQLKGSDMTGWGGNALSILNSAMNTVLGTKRPTAGCSFYAGLGEEAVRNNPTLNQRYEVGSIGGIRSPIGAVMTESAKAPLPMPHFVTVLWPKGESFDAKKALYCDAWESRIQCGPLHDFLFMYPVGFTGAHPVLQYRDAKGNTLERQVAADATWAAPLN